MNIEYYSKNIELADQTKEFISKKCQVFDKFKGRITSCRWNLSHDQHHRKGDVYRAEINLGLKDGNVLQVEETGEDLLAAVDLAKDKVKHQLVKLKNKLVSQRRK